MAVLIRSVVAVAPWLSAIPGALGTILLASQSCGLSFMDFLHEYSDAAQGLVAVSIVSIATFGAWTAVVLRSRRWKRAMATKSWTGRVAAVSSLCAGVVLGITASLLTYAIVAGVEDYCDRVELPIILMFIGIAMIPLSVAHLLLEVMAYVVREVRRQ